MSQSYPLCQSWKDKACCDDTQMGVGPLKDGYFTHIANFEQCGKVSEECKHFILVSGMKSHLHMRTVYIETQSTDTFATPYVTQQNW